MSQTLISQSWSHHVGYSKLFVLLTYFHQLYFVSYRCASQKICSCLVQNSKYYFFKWLSVSTRHHKYTQWNPENSVFHKQMFTASVLLNETARLWKTLPKGLYSFRDWEMYMLPQYLVLSDTPQLYSKPFVNILQNKSCFVLLCVKSFVLIFSASFHVGKVLWAHKILPKWLTYCAQC